jgi:phospholipid N-methyltransferase
MRQRWSDYRVFWREFREQYYTTGALLPSGRALASALARFVREGDNALPAHLRNGSETNANRAIGPRRILEVGPGTGAVTGAIINGMRPDDRLFLVERNEHFIEQLQARFKEDSSFGPVADRITMVHASVEDLSEDEPYDLIVSGLPLNNFAVDSVSQILDKLQRLLAPNGTLSFFEYVAVRKAKSLISRCDERERLRGISRVFENVLGKNEVRRDLVLLNVTPAWVHHVRFGGG